MTVPDAAIVAIKRFCEARTPPELREQMRLELRVRANSVTILDCRLASDETPRQWMRLPFAQLRYDPSTRIWTLYWPIAMTAGISTRTSSRPRISTRY